MSLTYLASPYSHPDPHVREYRYRQACRAAAKLMLAGEVVFAPIPHSLPIEQEMAYIQDGEFWKAQDAPYLDFCTKLAVLKLPGWDKSKGVAHEIAVALERGIPVEYLDP